MYINQPFLNFSHRGALAGDVPSFLLTSHSIHDYHIHGVKKLDITQHLCSSSPVLCNACRICVVLVSPSVLLPSAASVPVVCSAGKNRVLWFPRLDSAQSPPTLTAIYTPSHPLSTLSTALLSIHYLQISTHNEQTFIYFVFMTASFLGQHLGWMSKYHRY